MFCVRSQSEQESVLEQREQQCFLEAERLRCEREELEAQLLEYQHNLDRLREGQKSVEREKEKIETQQRLLQSWKHNRQSSLPVTIPLDGFKVRGRWGRKDKEGDAAMKGENIKVEREGWGEMDRDPFRRI